MQIFLILSILCCIPAYGILDTAKNRAFKFIEKPTVYNAGTYVIDKTATVLSTTATKFASIARFKETSEQKKQRLNKYVCRIDQRLARIENNLKQDEINAINNMYKEFEVTDEEQQTISAIIKQYKEYQQQYLYQAHEKTTEILAETSPEILSLCDQLNIHPTAIELRLADTSTSLAESTGLRVSYQLDDNNNLIMDDNIIGYPAIIFDPEFFTYPYEARIGTIAHELTHVALQHHAAQNILGMEIKYFTGAKTEDITGSKSWKNLETIYERQAEILLKDAEWASIMRNKRHNSYYNDHLFLGHYAQLTEIDELHKLKSKLQNMF